MRIKEKKEEINYNNILKFFHKRAKKFNENNPYSVTMYQDNNPELVKKRNNAEIKKIIPLLQLERESKVLDIACGVGRWADAIRDEKIQIKEYCGIDFCNEFIQLAKLRNGEKNESFYISSSTEVEKCLERNNKGSFNRVLLIGALIYLNDNDVKNTLQQVERICDRNSIICIREPIGIETRLTLKEQFSDELGDNYNAIYRSREELKNMFNHTLLTKGFEIVEENFLFQDNNLNNRKETAQYYWILSRNES